jgi:hypothetical protein
MPSTLSASFARLRAAAFKAPVFTLRTLPTLADALAEQITLDTIMNVDSFIALVKVPICVLLATVGGFVSLSL